MNIINTPNIANVVQVQLNRTPMYLAQENGTNDLLLL